MPKTYSWKYEVGIELQCQKQSDTHAVRTLRNGSWLCLLSQMVLRFLTVVLLVIGAGIGKRPLLSKPHGGIPRSSEIQDSRLHPEAVVLQYHCPITSSLCEQPFAGLAASMIIFWGPKLPQQREGPGISLCVQTLK